MSLVICPLTGGPHRPLWLRSAWWCEDCRQKLETCCEGECPSSIVEPTLSVEAQSVVSEG
jgi:hypothetical protein